MEDQADEKGNRIIKFKSHEEIDAEKLKGYISQAVLINEKGIQIEKKAIIIEIPEGFQEALNQNPFGLWCAIAIHDTSSVIGATIDYGNEALSVATTVKLSRTLWIIPLSIFSMFIFNTKGEKIKIPYFILLFIIAITINSFHLLPTSTTAFFVLISKRLLVVTLFLIGSTISLKKPNKEIIKPIAFALVLWLFISIFSLMYLTY
jgi:uncharacterized membrane protein YadS